MGPSELPEVVAVSKRAQVRFSCMTYSNRGKNVLLLSVLLGVVLLSGCGVSYQPSRMANFDLDRVAEIDDEAIRKAFEARPQLPERYSVAFYSFDEKRAGDIEAMLESLPGVSSTYRIPSLVVSGQRRFSSNRHHYGQPTTAISLKKLRLLAARARADVLIVVDAGYRSGGANALVALNILVLPALFVPFLDNQVESYLEAFVIDTRNGFLYGHLSEDEKSGPKYATVYADSAKTIVDEQWVSLRAKMGGSLTKLLGEESRLHAAQNRLASVAEPKPLAALPDEPAGKAKEPSGDASTASPLSAPATTKPATDSD